MEDYYNDVLNDLEDLYGTVDDIDIDDLYDVGNETFDLLDDVFDDVFDKLTSDLIDSQTEAEMLALLLEDSDIEALLDQPDQLGYTDDRGRLIRTDEEGNVLPKIEGEFDEDGNFWPKGADYYFDMYGYRHLIESINPFARYDEDGNFFNGSNAYFDISGLSHPIVKGRGGYYSGSNFMLDGGEEYIDKNGYVHKILSNDKKRFDMVKLNNKTRLTTDKLGRLKIIGLKGYFHNDGLFNRPDGKLGYFNSRGEFIEDKVNRYKLKNGFYDDMGNWYSFNSFYKDNLGVNKVVLPPMLDIRLEDEKIKIGKLKGHFTVDGLYTVNGNTGYFDENNVFVSAKMNPYKGGFYAEGEWINESFFKDFNGSLKLNLGEYDNFGNYRTAYDDIGSFNNQGRFNPFLLNKDKEGFYDSQGKKYLFGRTYKDELSNVWTLGKPSFYTKAGVKVEGEYVLGEDTNKGKLMYDGVAIRDNLVGYFDEAGQFNKGKIPYTNGYYTNNGDYIRAKEASHQRGEAHVYGDFIVLDKSVILPNGIQVKAERDGKANILIGGLVINDKGQIGFYDKQGNFKTSKEIDSFVVEDNGQVGYYNSEGTLVATMDKNKGFYDDERNYHFYNNPDFFDKKGNLLKEDGSVWYIDSEGKEVEGTNPYANGFYVEKDNFVGEEEPRLMYYNKLGVLVSGKELPYTDGFYDKYRNFHPFKDTDGFLVEEKAKKLKKGTMLVEGKYRIYPDLTVVTANGKETKAKKENISGKDYLQFTKTDYIDENLNVGQIDKKGNFKKTAVAKLIEDDGFILSNDTIVLLDGTMIEADGTIKKAKLDKDKVVYLGNNKYMKPNGEVGTKEKFYGYQDVNGTIYKTGPNAIGIIDDLGNFIAKDLEGHFDMFGTYRDDNNLYGYYDNEGNFYFEEENVYNDGYYDHLGNWHTFGDIGYYKPNGEYVKSVEDLEIGYYNKDGVYLQGSNPYVKGFYNSKAEWFEHGLAGKFDTEGNYIDEDGTKKYFDKDGNLQVGENPYVDGYYNNLGELTKFVEGQSFKYFNKEGKELVGVSPYVEGFYDNMKNWHPFGEEGYYTVGGTFVDKDKNLFYYDKFGGLNVGYNAYLYGYYDSNNNWHPFKSNGFYSSDGTFNAENGEVGYFTKDGTFIRNKRNTNPEGFYDEFNNFIPFDEDGFYNERQQFIPDRYYDSQFEFGSDDYIYDEGYFANGIPNILKRNSKTLQYTTNKNVLNPLYIESGILVPGNYVVEFEDIRDALHGLFLNLKKTGTFVKDNDYSMLVYDGRVVKLERDKGITVNEIKRLFADTDLDLSIKTTRAEGDFRIVDAIETNQPINFFKENNMVKINKPLLSRNNIAYMSASDMANIVGHKVVFEPINNTGIVSFVDNKKGEDLTFNFILGSSKFEVNKLKLSALEGPVISETVNDKKEVYLPISMLNELIDDNENLYWDSKNYNFRITSEDLVGRKAR